MRDETPRSLKSDLLNAPNRLGASVIELVAADVAEHGEGVIAALRQQNPAACARLTSDVVALKRLVTECLSITDPAPLPGKMEAIAVLR